MNRHRTALAMLLALAAPGLPGQAAAGPVTQDQPLLAIHCAFEEAAADSVEIVAATATGTAIDYSARVLARLGAPRDLRCSLRPYAAPNAAPAEVAPANVFASIQTILL